MRRYYFFFTYSVVWNFSYCFWFHEVEVSGFFEDSVVLYYVLLEAVLQECTWCFTASSPMRGALTLARWKHSWVGSQERTYIETHKEWDNAFWIDIALLVFVLWHFTLQRENVPENFSGQSNWVLRLSMTHSDSVDFLLFLLNRADSCCCLMLAFGLDCWYLDNEEWTPPKERLLKRSITPFS